MATATFTFSANTKAKSGEVNTNFSEINARFPLTSTNMGNGIVSYRLGGSETIWETVGSSTRNLIAKTVRMQFGSTEVAGGATTDQGLPQPLAYIGLALATLNSSVLGQTINATMPNESTIRLHLSAGANRSVSWFVIGEIA